MTRQQYYKMLMGSVIFESVEIDGCLIQMGKGNKFSYLRNIHSLIGLNELCCCHHRYCGKSEVLSIPADNAFAYGIYG